MRLALVIYGDLDLVSGGFLYDRRLVDYLRRRGDQVEIVSLPWRSYPLGLLDNFSPGLRRRLAGLQADMVLQDGLAHPSLFCLNRHLRKIRPGPLVALIHHLRSCEDAPYGQNYLYRRVERRYLDSVDGFIYPSRAMRREVEKLASGSRPGVVAHPGGDHLPRCAGPDDISRRAMRPGPLTIAAVANLIPRKGLHTLVEALARLPRGEAWRLRIAGSLTADPAYVRSLRRRIAELGSADRVTLLGTLTPEGVSDLLNRSQVLAVPARFEALGIVFLEAMRVGLPVIASTAGGAGEICTHGREGFLVPPGEVQALADCLKIFLIDRGCLLEMSLAAWERSGAHPTWDDSLARVRQFLVDMSRSS
jgi:glycosyltransferase involved in cell wall biosynthesis